MAYPNGHPQAAGGGTAKRAIDRGADVRDGRVWTQPWAQTAALLEVDGLGCVTEPLASGQGVIFLGPHLGNWELLGMHLATLGNLVALYEPIPLKKLDQLVHRGRQGTGGKLVPTTPRGIAELVRSVRAGGITGILPDQVPTDQNAGINAPFFGVECFTQRSRLISSKIGPRQ